MRGWLVGCFASFLVAFNLTPVFAHHGVVARVNGVDITESDVDVAGKMFGPQLGALSEEARRSAIIDALIEMRVIADAAKAVGLDKADGYALRMEFFEGQTLSSLLMEKSLTGSVTDEHVRQAYDEHLKTVQPALEVKLSHILTSTRLAAESMIEALDSGRDFGSLARQHSLDQSSKARGGDLGFLTGREASVLVAAASRLAPGQYSRVPVESASGFHVIRLEQRREQPPPPFESIAARIRSSLEAEAAKRLVAELRAKARVEKLDPSASASPPANGR